MTSNAIKHIVIVGGGSAGWLTAGLIAAEHRGKLQVTLIESPDIAPIGVGEGTWPSMRDTLRKIGVSESDFFRECDAAFKQGSRFNGWVDGSASDVYFHPFVLPQGYGETDLIRRWQDRYAHVPFADLVSFQPHLCVAGKAPKQAVTPEFASVANYGYHLDAGKFGQFLKKHCLERLNVRYVPDNVVGIHSVGVHSSSASAADSDIGAHIANDIAADIAGDTTSEIGSDIDSEIGSVIGSEIGSEIGSVIGSEIGSDSGSDIASDSGSDIASDSGSDIASDSGSDIASDIDSDIDSDITIDATRDIAFLQTQHHGAIAGDLFIDCTGMQSLLLGKHYGIEFLSQKHVLFNDRALAVQIPYPDAASPIASQTSSTAQRCGWIWDIGLPSRRGIGHVYSSTHTTDEAAERELRDYIIHTGGPADIPAPRKLSFNPGYRKHFWHRNVVAIGLSAGFIEPLEASALALVELSAAMVSEDMPATRAAMDIVARRFNDAFTYRWERVIDFLKLHYVLSRRTDSQYWLDNRANASVPQRVQDLLTLWRHRPPSRTDFYRIDEVFPAASYQYVLYGMGFRGELDLSTTSEQADHYFREAAALTRKMLPALPSNRELIDHIRRHGLQKI